MRKAYKFRLYPTRKQAQTLQWTLDRCREVYDLETLLAAIQSA